MFETDESSYKIMVLLAASSFNNNDDRNNILVSSRLNNANSDEYIETTKIGIYGWRFGIDFFVFFLT